ncbi:MAG: hypothetical protein CSA33_00245 [Desulfobulbus propionicus]|nr:MAG: hypothetical protein CSA33_00245 [Desulfobulbus propionicus]
MSSIETNKKTEEYANSCYKPRHLSFWLFSWPRLRSRKNTKDAGKTDICLDQTRFFLQHYLPAQKVQLRHA